MQCPYCRSQKTVWRGFRYNMKGKTRMRQCTKCERKFTPGAFARMRHSEGTILKAISLYKKEKSSSKARKRLKEDGVKVSRWTILKWFRKFGK